MLNCIKRTQTISKCNPLPLTGSWFKVLAGGLTYIY